MSRNAEANNRGQTTINHDNPNKSWSVPYYLVGVLVVSALLLAFIPFLGQVQSLQTLVLGGIALVFVLKIIQASIPELANVKIDPIPGFWFTVGLLTVGAIMPWVGIMVAALAALAALAVTAIGEKAEGVGQLLMFPIAAIFGFIPVFIYGAWLGGQLKHGL